MKYEHFSSLSADKIWTMATDEIKPTNEILEKLNAHLKCFDGQIQKSMKDINDKVNQLNSSNEPKIIQAISKDIMKKSAICTTE